MKATHIITLSFDDGFLKSNIRIAEIYEKHECCACFNVIATGHLPEFAKPDRWHNAARGDFGLWNELQARGHEIMPHGVRHADKAKMPIQEAKDLILRCLGILEKELSGFDPGHAVFNFPYNSSSAELEAWLPTVVRAYRTGGSGIHPLPHPGLVRLTATARGPGNCESYLDECIAALLSRPSGWLIFNTHGLDDEGWGPIGADYLDRLLGRLAGIPGVAVLPAGRALMGAG